MLQQCSHSWWLLLKSLLYLSICAPSQSFPTIASLQDWSHQISLVWPFAHLNQDLCLRVYLVQSSAADGPRGLSVGDIVTGLEDCPVRGVEDWTSCLSHLAHTPQTGYCVPVASLQPSWAHGRGGWGICSARPPDLLYQDIRNPYYFIVLYVRLQ